MGSSRATKPRPIHAERLARCRRAMKKHGIGAFLVSKHMDSFYLTGFTGEDSAMLVLPREVHAISDGRFDEVLNLECPWATKWMRKGSLNAEIARVCRALKIKKLAVQPDHVSLADYAEIEKQVNGTRLVHAPAIISEMRRIKDAQELTVLRKALRVAERAFEVVRAGIRVGQTELELAARLEFEMKQRGASSASFPTIVAEGANAALPHAHPGQRKVKSGSAILFDWGARLGEYCSDLTRVVFIDSIPPSIGAVYEVVLEAQLRSIAAIRPGARMCDVDAVARTYIKNAGYGEAFNHGLGHGVGLNIHEAPSLSWRSSEKLVAGMVVTVEPGVYLPGLGGVRIEDDVLVTARGCKVLSRLDKSLEGAVVKARRPA